MKPITWKSVTVDVSKIKPTPKNYKIKTDDGLARFKTSTKKYGRAGTVILNADFTLIDGNTRWEEAKQNKEKRIEASMPSRLLNKKEFEEFSAMFDFARAGEVDLNRIKKELGTTDSFLKQWGINLPKNVMDNLAELEKAEGVIKPKEKSKAVEAVAVSKPVTLLFTAKENEVFIRKAEGLYAKYKVDNVTDLVFTLISKM